MTTDPLAVVVDDTRRRCLIQGRLATAVLCAAGVLDVTTGMWRHGLRYSPTAYGWVLGIDHISHVRAAADYLNVPTIIRKRDQ